MWTGDRWPFDVKHDQPQDLRTPGPPGDRGQGTGLAPTGITNLYGDCWPSVGLSGVEPGMFGQDWFEGDPCVPGQLPANTNHSIAEIVNSNLNLIK